MLRIMFVTYLLLLIVPTSSDGLIAMTYAAGGTSLRFYGTDASELDRVQIPLGPINNGQIMDSYPVNVAGDFTIEFWMKAIAAGSSAPFCENGWYYGNIIIDRDVDGSGDYGDYGVALCAGRIAFGVSVGEDDRQLVGDTSVTDGQWHHIAVTRADGGRLVIFVDGRPDGSTDGPSGPVNYRPNRETSQPASDPYLVLGAEKHGYPGSYHYSGLLDELRISDGVRYSGPFSRPDGPHPVDARTVALYRFDEGSGTSAGDATGGPAAGTLIVAGDPPGPVWSTDTPFAPTEAAATATPTEVAATAIPTEVAATAIPTEVAVTAPSVETYPGIAAAPSAEASGPTRPTAGPAVPARPVEATSSVSAAPPTQASLTLATAEPVDAGADDRTAELPDTPPPNSGISTLLLAWVAAAVIAGLAIAAGIRLRSRL